MIRELEQLPPRVYTSGRSREQATGELRTMVPVYDFSDKSSPCRESCPAGHDISWALHLVQAGEFDTAHALFREESPFPSITGRICYHPCETWCNRKDYDEPIAINALERAMADYGTVEIAPAEARYAEQPVAVVGSGPAGVTVAYHLVQLGYPVTLFERDDELGGALRYGIPRYRLPADVLDGEFDRLRALGIEFRTGTSIGTDVAWDDLDRDFAAVFLGLGKPRGRDLSAPGMDDIDARRGVDFLRDVNASTVDALEGDVVVIGGGDVAIDCVRSSIRLGATSVYLFCLEALDQMPAHPAEIDEATSEGLFLNPSAAVEFVEKQPDGRTALTFRDVTLFSIDAPPELGDGRRTLVVDHVICAIGQQPDADWLPGDLWSDGQIGVDGVGRTRKPSVFSGGDVAGSYNVVQAIGAGKRAAIGIDCYLRGWDAAVLARQASVGGKGAISMREYRDARGGTNGDGGSTAPIVKIDDINLDYFPALRREQRPEAPISARRDFREVNGTLTREQAVVEAARCFNCSECTVCGNCFVYCPDSAVIQMEDDFFTIDGDHCKGCGVCVKECPRSAMTMVIEREL